MLYCSLVHINLCYVMTTANYFVFSDKLKSGATFSLVFIISHFHYHFLVIHSLKFGSKCKIICKYIWSCVDDHERKLHE